MLLLIAVVLSAPDIISCNYLSLYLTSIQQKFLRLNQIRLGLYINMAWSESFKSYESFDAVRSEASVVTSGLHPKLHMAANNRLRRVAEMNAAFYIFY